jgi:hypothetical protein
VSADASEDDLADDRYIIITVAYHPSTGHGRSLEWAAPELKDADLKLIVDRSESRTWSGTVDGLTFARFADAWRLHDQPTHDENAQTYFLDGMNWEVSGEPSIVYAHVRIVPGGHEAEAGSGAEGTRASAATVTTNAARLRQLRVVRRF